MAAEYVWGRQGFCLPSVVKANRGCAEPRMDELYLELVFGGHIRLDCLEESVYVLDQLLIVLARVLFG